MGCGWHLKTDEFFGFGNVELEVIILAPSDSVGHLLTAMILVAVSDETDYGGIVCILVVRERQ